MELWLIIAALTGFNYISNPEIRPYGVQAELSYYELSERLVVRQHGKEKDKASFAPGTVLGMGATLQTQHLAYRNWIHTVNIRHYPGLDFYMNFFTTGLDYMVQYPQMPIQLSIGAEIGYGDLNISALDKFGQAQPTIGWEVHTMFVKHFVVNETIWHGFIRPTLRHYRFNFEGNSEVISTGIDAQGFAISAGFGTRF